MRECVCVSEEYALWMSVAALSLITMGVFVKETA